jgi:hypothetical protein
MSVTKFCSMKFYTVFHKGIPMFQFVIFIEWYKSEKQNTMWLTVKSEILFSIIFKKSPLVKPIRNSHLHT